jgi:hypothetical protein
MASPRPSEVAESPCRSAVKSERLLDDDVLAGLDGCRRKRNVRRVRRANVDDVDARIFYDTGNIGRGAIYAKRACARYQLIWLGAGQGNDLAVSASANCVHVVGADEPRPDDRNLEERPTSHAHHASLMGGSVGMTERRNATAFPKPSSMESSASSCSIDSTPSYPTRRRALKYRRQSSSE